MSRVRFVLLCVAGLALGCPDPDACRAVGLACPTPSEPTPFVGTPSPEPVGAPPAIVVVDPDPIVTYGQDDFILCIEVEDPDQGGNMHQTRMWFDPAEYDVSANLVLWNLNGISQTFCWTTWGTVQNEPVRTAYLHIEAVDNLGNPTERVVQWRALP